MNDQEQQDPHAGLGGAYEMKDGKRVLVHRTQDAPGPVQQAEGGAGPAAEVKAVADGVASPLPEVAAKAARKAG